MRISDWSSDVCSSDLTDFSRAPKSEVLAFMLEDLEFASQYLPVENPVGDHLSKAAADHLLAETYISTGDFEKAIAAATRVIDDGHYQLMTTRFRSEERRVGKEWVRTCRSRW